MEIWEQSDEWRIAAAQGRWAVEYVSRRPFEQGWCVRDGRWWRILGEDATPAVVRGRQN
jgi:hypothetical protein